jgi:hypothetical protein
MRKDLKDLFCKETGEKDFLSVYSEENDAYYLEIPSPKFIRWLSDRAARNMETVAQESKFKKAFDVFKEEVRTDSVFYIAYKDDIAMSFYDACQSAGYCFPELQKIANIAADNVLKLFLSKARQDLEENSNSNQQTLPANPEGTCEARVV